MIKKLKRIYENIYYKLVLLEIKSTRLVKPRHICEEITRDLKKLKKKWKL